jgi:hypothetical protein
VHREVRGLASFLGEDRGLSALLLLLLATFFVIPLFSAGLARLLGAAAFSLVFLSGAGSLSGGLLGRAAAWAAVLLALTLRWLETVSSEPLLAQASAAASLFFLLLLTAQVLGRVFRSGPVTAHRVQGAVSAYVLFGVCWALLYELLALRLPGAFSYPAAAPAGSARDASLAYFSFATLTTVGYGDVTAVHPVARMFSILEALTGQLYPATLLARLVSLEIMHRDAPRAAPGRGKEER